MDVAVQSTCSHCGYLRIGIPADARCPECGGPPPTLVTPLIAAAGAAADRSQQAWLATISLGLLLLIVCTVCAIQSELYLDEGGLTLVAINAPAPKLTAAACLLREIGKPGEWGIEGFLATLGTVLAVWLITVPHPSLSEPGFFTVRRLARAFTVLLFGAFFSVLVSGYVISLWRWAVLPSLFFAVGGVELPVNLALYLYLAKFSRRFDATERAGARYGLFAAAWLFAATCIAGLTMSWLRGAWEDKPVTFWRNAQAAYGMLAIGAGVVMCSGVVRLLGRTLLAAMDVEVASLPGALRGLIEAVHRLIGRIRREPTRFAALAGLLLWMDLWWPSLAGVASDNHRQGLLRDLPAFNFLAPKIWMYSLTDDLFVMVAAVWLMTSFRPAKGEPFAIWTRWSITLALGALMGFTEAIAHTEDEGIRAAAGAIKLLAEAPSTLVIYFFLAAIAQQLVDRRLARGLRVVGVIAVALMVWPWVFDWIASNVRVPGYRVTGTVLAAAAYGPIVIGSALAAWAFLLRLAWALLNGRASAEPEMTP